MKTEMRIEIYAKSKKFINGTPLDISLSILNDFNKIYTSCINKSKKFYDKDEHYYFEPQLNIDYIKRSSLHSLFTVDLPAAYAMIGPLVAGYSWDLFKTTFDFAHAYIGSIKKNQEIPTVNIQDSPGSTNVIMTVIGNGSINVGREVFDNYNVVKKEVSNLAQFVESDVESSLSIKRLGYQGEEDADIEINSLNSSSFIIEEKEIISDEPISYPCKIYSLNTKTKKGRLDIITDGDKRDLPGSISFEVQGGDINDYIEAMKGGSVALMATARMVVNTIGERRITSLYPKAILKISE